MLLSIHVAAGGLALLLGALALWVRKGGTVHRRGGLLFVYAMVVMAASAAVLGNLFGGLRLWKVRRRRALPVHIRHEPVPLTTAAQ